MIAIIDYGMGNLRSVQKAVLAVGSEAEVISDPQSLRLASHVILPGVGAFADAMAELRRSGLGDAFVEAVHAGKPCLGVCLGLQLLFDTSSEDGEHTGLGLLPGKVIRFASKPGLKIPHMGWNSLALTGRFPCSRMWVPSLRCTSSTRTMLSPIAPMISPQSRTIRTPSPQSSGATT